MAQETCVGDQCNPPGSIYRTITQMAVSGQISAGVILNAQSIQYNLARTLADLRNATVPLGAFTATYAAHRLGFNSAGDGGDAWYVWSSSATCNDDGGSCVRPSQGPGRWLLLPQYPINPMIFGVGAVGPLVFYADSLLGNDRGGLNYCRLSGDPCKTAALAVQRCAAFAHFNNTLSNYVKIGARTYNETINFNTSSVTVNGATGEGDIGCGLVGPDTVGGGKIVGDGVQCGTIIATGAPGWVQDIEIDATAAACQSGLYAQEGGRLQVFGAVMGAASACQFNTEETGSQINIWPGTYTIKGAAAAQGCVTNEGAIIYNGNTLFTHSTISVPTYSTAYWIVTGAGTVQIGGGQTWANPASYGLLAQAATNAVVQNNTTGPVWPNCAAQPCSGTITKVALTQGGGRVYPEAYPATCSVDSSFGTTGTCVVIAGGSTRGMKITVTPGGSGITTAGTITVKLPTLCYPEGGGSSPNMFIQPVNVWGSNTIRDGGYTQNADLSFNWFLGWTGTIVSGTPYNFTIGCGV